MQKEFCSCLLLEHIETSVIATDASGEVVLWNRFASELYQYEESEAVGKSVLDLTPSEMTQEQGMEIVNQLAKGENWKGMFQIKRKDGSHFMAHVTDTPFMDPSGEVQFIVGLSADFSDLHSTKRELESQNDSLEKEVRAQTKQSVERDRRLRMVGAAVEQSDVGVLITNEDISIIWINPAVSRMLQWTEEKVLRCLPWDLPVRRDDGTGEQILSSFYLESDPLQHTQTHGLLNDCYLQIGLQPVPGTTNLMVTWRDLTAQRKANEAAKALVTSKSKTEMIRMMSHEFRTPLQGIMGVASTNLSGLSTRDDERYDSYSSILANSRVLLTLINNVLDLAEMENETLVSIELLSAVHIAQCIHRAVQYCSVFAELNEVRLVVADSLDYPCQASSRHVERILINLLCTAVTRTGPGTDVGVSHRRCPIQEAIRMSQQAPSAKPLTEEQRAKRMHLSGEAVIVSIRDHGGVVLDTEFGNLFEPYSEWSAGSRSVASTGRLADNGLGFAFVTELVSRMNGRVWCKNVEGGVEFSFFLPGKEWLPRLGLPQQLDRWGLSK